MLTLKGVSKRYANAEHPVLDTVNLCIAPGESLAIMGASGSGKSTLLNIAAGLVEPDTGEVLIGEQNIIALPPPQRDTLRANTLGMVFQQFNLIECLSAEHNITLVCRYLGLPYEHEFQRLINILGIAHRISAPLGALSGGEQQRVAIARALLHQPKLVLADEPTGNLDADTSVEVADLLFGLCKESQTSLVVVTHSDAIAERAKRSVRLERGRLC